MERTRPSIVDVVGNMADQYLETALVGKSESTRKTYVSTLAQCLKATKCKDSRALLIGRANTFRKLAKIWPVTNTLKKALSMLCCIVHANPKILPETTAKYWQKCLKDASDAVKKESDKNVVSEALQAKWMDYDDIMAKVQALRKLGNEHASLKASKELVILAMYAFLTPKRADFGKLRIVDSVNELTATENGVVLPANGECKLVLNVYKTAKTYKQFVETLPSELVQVLRASLKAFPRSFILVGPRNKPLSDDNYATQVKAVMDKHFDRKLSINDLRHIYLTQTIVLATITREERNKIAWSMMQSPEVQLEYVRVLSPAN
jgi:benzoyl-CoA reductase/2-hydroxyglutaryl-CoA dehydratase subunit BcrC/BadD/HgdB